MSIPNNETSDRFKIIISPVLQALDKIVCCPYTAIYFIGDEV